jgi:hypothetical protein
MVSAAIVRGCLLVNSHSVDPGISGFAGVGSSAINNVSASSHQRHGLASRRSISIQLPNSQGPARLCPVVTTPYQIPRRMLLGPAMLTPPPSSPLPLSRLTLELWDECHVVCWTHSENSESDVVFCIRIFNLPSRPQNHPVMSIAQPFFLYNVEYLTMLPSTPYKHSRNTLSRRGKSQRHCEGLHQCDIHETTCRSRAPR